MTVGELIAHLRQFPKDLPVVVNWDDGYSDPGEIDIKSIPCGKYPAGIVTVVVGAGEYGSFKWRLRKES